MWQEAWNSSFSSICLHWLSERSERAHISLYADTGPIFYLVTRFLSTHPAEKAALWLNPALHGSKKKKVIYQHQYLHSGWLSVMKKVTFVSFCVPYVHNDRSDTHSKTSSVHTHHSIYSLNINTNGRQLSSSSSSSNSSGGGGAALQIPAQWDWLMSLGKQKE